MLPTESSYDAEYYAHRCAPIPYERSAHWLNFFNGIASEIVRSLRPKRVFDAGCAWGFLVEAFWDLGVEAQGVDISNYAISQVRRDMQPFCRAGSLTEPIPGSYDLITCIEVLEHMPEEEAEQAVRNMTAASDTILFSSSPNEFNEPTHINVRPTIYWLKLFAQHCFAPDLLFDASFLISHAFLVRRQPEPPRDDVIRLFNETLTNRIYKAAFVTRQSRLEELERERENLNGQISQLKVKLQELASKPAELQASQAALQATREEFNTLRGLGDIWRQQAVDFEAAFNAATSQGARLSQTIGVLQTALQEIHTSPGWRLITKYRDWLRRNERLRKRFEPAALWAIRAMKLVSNRPAAAIEPVPSQPAAPVPLLQPAPNIESNSYHSWIESSEPSPSQLAFQRRIGAHFSYRPVVSVIVPVYKVPDEVLHEAVDSVMAQTYDRWELCLAHADIENGPQREYLKSLAEKDARVKVKLLTGNAGISGNSNQALELAAGEFLALLDHDDTLAPFALFEVVQLLNEDSGANFIYSDKDQLDDSGRRLAPLFKPQWSPHIMLSANYLTHLCVMRTEQVREIGGWRKETDGAQDWDLFLRIAARYGNVRHIPKVLYHWRRIATSVAAGGIDVKPYAAQAQVRAVADYCGATGLDAKVEFVSGIGVRISWPPQARVKAAIFLIGGSAARAEELRARTNHPDFEVVVTSVADLEGAINRSSAELLVLLDESVNPIDPDWLSELTGPLRDPSVGLVGARLIDAATGLIRHCGIVFNQDGSLENLYAGQPEHVCEEFGAAAWYRDWTAVNGACLAIRRNVWKQAGGLSAAPAYPRHDIDLCLRIGLHCGLRVVYNPFARFYQSAVATLEMPVGRNTEQAAQFVRSCFPSGDPNFNPNLICQNGNVRLISPGRPPTQSPTDYSADSRALVQIYDFSEDQVEQSKAVCSTPRMGRLDRVTWFLPEFTNPFYGGLHTILRFADGFRRFYNTEAAFCIVGNGDAARYRRSIEAAFPALAGSMDVSVIRNVVEAAALAASDASVTTLWTTAWASLHYQKTRQKFYFIQDDESLFYPAGSTSALVEASYHFGFQGICNTISLLQRYRARGGDGEYFTPAVDPAVFHAQGREPVGQQKPYRLFCYARPGHPRNCFEMLGAALRILKERFAEELVILTAGAAVDLNALGLEGVAENLGLLGYRSTGALYRMCDAGLVMMMTRHPSYLPLELMACGALVVTNRNPDTTWLLEDGVNCLLADPSPTSLADRVEEGLRNVALRRRIVENATATMARDYSNWDEQIEKIYRYMVSRS